ncbi:GIY-YIG nuclease family protein [Neobacillus novalis]|uniref:GIY-YIG nuclease family protein n=1 Tax=Neobacillus novalis TaxID=220687 RepID=A0AA95MNV1_9BACI|nr:GIY-YIG nuclease family protein [Neobacillus novalis]WHY87499.1 GIY-YIG nuclease family protein [Neobacillus novalis]
MNLKDKVKNLPASPGVYLMKDSSARIIYVGKAKNLKNRVQTYFQNSKSHSQKIKKLQANINDFEIILTDTEFEAFLLECKLIQDIKPLFNKKMKNPQSYTYILIDMKEDTRKLEISNNPEKGGYLSFGPFTSIHSVEKAVQGLKEFYQISCSSPANKHSPCLNFSLGLCLGMCTGAPQAIAQYNYILNKIIALLNGSDTSILEEIKQRMSLAAEEFDFETAAKYRNYLDAINFLIKKEAVIGFTEANKNIVIIEPLTEDTIKLFLIKGNIVLFSERYLLPVINLEQLVHEIKIAILSYFNSKAHHLSQKVSKNDIDKAQIIHSYLKSRNCIHRIIPQKWIKTRDSAKIAEALTKTLVKVKTRLEKTNLLS